VILKARLVGPMLDVPTQLNTTSGETIQVPSLSAYSSSSTVTAQGANFTESDPTFNSFVNLGAFKYGFLIQVSREMIEDSGVDLLGFLADQVGNGLGYNVQNALTNGTGTVQPQGIVTAAGSGITGATSVSGAFTADNLIDLYYSLDGAARLLPGVGWMMNGASIGAVRKLKDTAGNYIFSPAADGNQRDSCSGARVREPACPVGCYVGQVGHRWSHAELLRPFRRWHSPRRGLTTSRSTRISLLSAQVCDATRHFPSLRISSTSSVALPNP
jgi:HK97 family phage major capsid protein